MALVNLLKEESGYSISGFMDFYLFKNDS